MLPHAVERPRGFAGSSVLIDLSDLGSTRAAWTGELWFKAPALSTSADTTFYLSDGNTDFATADEPKVWSSGCGAVWHPQDAETGAAGEYRDRSP